MSKVQKSRNYWIQLTKKKLQPAHRKLLSWKNKAVSRIELEPITPPEVAVREPEPPDQISNLADNQIYEEIVVATQVGDSPIMETPILESYLRKNQLSGSFPEYENIGNIRNIEYDPFANNESFNQYYDILKEPRTQSIPKILPKKGRKL